MNNNDELCEKLQDELNELMELLDDHLITIDEYELSKRIIKRIEFDKKHK